MLDANAAATQIPSSVYVIIGTLIVANIGTVVTIFYGIGKVVWFISKLDSRVEVLERETAKDIDAAHQAIRDIRTQIPKCELTN
jgi:SpoU rRNA methylase family enzyme